MNDILKKAKSIAENVGAQLLKEEKNFSKFHGTILRYRYQTKLGTIYFTLTEKPFAAMRWVPGFNRAVLQCMFDQQVSRKSLRWDLISSDNDSFLFELECRLNAINSPELKTRTKKAA